MRQARLVLFLLAPLAGCAADTMRGYIGQDIRAVELAYGPPSNQIDLGNGVRAFQWTKISVDTTPFSAVSTTDKDKKGRPVTQTNFVGGDQSVTRCLYTFLTAWNPQINGWVVTGFRQPSLDCAIGGLSYGPARPAGSHEMYSRDGKRGHAHEIDSLAGRPEL